jgi:CubicO group peptidase (beta-lactamase class C family)
MEGRLLSEASTALMRTRGKTRDGKTTNYGFGWGIYDIDGLAIMAHSGSQEKTSTDLAVVPEAQLGLAVMCNCEGAKLEPLVKDFLLRALAGRR